MSIRIDEHVNAYGHLVVPVASTLDPAPKRQGWRAWWVNVDLDRVPQKLVYYKPEPSEVAS